MNIYILCIIGVFAISCLCGFVFIPLILNFCKQKNLYDIPDERKIHNNAIPRLGGISFMPSMFISFICALVFLNVKMNGITVNLWTMYFITGMALIYFVGMADDVFGLSPITKFIIQIIAACFLPMAGLYVNNLYGLFGVYDISFFVGFPLTVFLIVFVINAINLIDGIDGLSAGLSVIAFACFLYLFSLRGLWIYSILITGIIGVLIPYLYFNIFGNPQKNRKIFMGDSGSLTLGFILGFLSVKYVAANTNVQAYDPNSLITAFTLLVVPTFDVVRVGCVRIYHKRSPMSPDKTHIHHKLMKAGLSQHQALIVILLFAGLFIILNKSLLHILDSTAIVAIDSAIFILFNLILNYIICKKTKAIVE